MTTEMIVNDAAGARDSLVLHDFLKQLTALQGARESLSESLSPPQRVVADFIAPKLLALVRRAREAGASDTEILRQLVAKLAELRDGADQRQAAIDAEVDAQKKAWHQKCYRQDRWLRHLEWLLPLLQAFKIHLPACWRSFPEPPARYRFLRTAREAQNLRVWILTQQVRATPFAVLAERAASLLSSVYQHWIWRIDPGGNDPINLLQVVFAQDSEYATDEAVRRMLVLMGQPADDEEARWWRCAMGLEPLLLHLGLVDPDHARQLSCFLRLKAAQLRRWHIRRWTKPHIPVVTHDLTQSTTTLWTLDPRGRVATFGDDVYEIVFVSQDCTNAPRVIVGDRLKRGGHGGGPAGHYVIEKMVLFATENHYFPSSWGARIRRIGP